MQGHFRHRRRRAPHPVCFCAVLSMVTVLSSLLLVPQYDHKRISKLAERLTQKIMKSLPDVVMNGDPEHHYPGMNKPFPFLFWKSLRL